jgi:predicted nucleic acid-binding protein
MKNNSNFMEEMFKEIILDTSDLISTILERMGRGNTVIKANESQRIQKTGENNRIRAIFAD